MTEVVFRCWLHCLNCPEFLTPLTGEFILSHWNDLIVFKWSLNVSLFSRPLVLLRMASSASLMVGHPLNNCGNTLALILQLLTELKHHLSFRYSALGKWVRKSYHLVSCENLWLSLNSIVGFYHHASTAPISITGFISLCWTFFYVNRLEWHLEGNTGNLRMEQVICAIKQVNTKESDVQICES